MESFKVKASFVPSAGLGSATVLVIETLAAEVGLTLAEALWVPLGSAVVWDSVAVFMIGRAVALTVTVIVAEAPAPSARVPTVQVTVPEDCEIEPVAVDEDW